MIDWLVQSAAAHSALARGEAPAGMLSRAEEQRLAGLRYERRRRDWLLGRWAAKRLLQRYLAALTGQQVPLAALTIASAPDGAPLVQLQGAGFLPPSHCVESGQYQEAPVTLSAGRSRSEGSRVRSGLRCFAAAQHDTGQERDDAALQAASAGLSISISHSGGLALCALADGHTPIGADIERIAPRGPQFAADYFTPAELAQLAAAPAALHDTYSMLIWSAKEAALKALRLGLTVDTREVEIELAAPESQSVQLTRSVFDDSGHQDAKTQRVQVAEKQHLESACLSGKLLAQPCHGAAGWAPLRAHYRPRDAGTVCELHGWWRIAGEFVLTLALADAP